MSDKCPFCGCSLLEGENEEFQQRCQSLAAKSVMDDADLRVARERIKELEYLVF